MKMFYVPWLVLFLIALLSRAAETPTVAPNSYDKLIQAILAAPTQEARSALLPTNKTEGVRLAKQLNRILIKQRSRRLSEAAVELATGLGDTNLLAEAWYWRAKVFATYNELD